MLTQKGALTLSELSSQGDVWKQVIQTVDKEQQKIVPWFMKEGFTAVVFTGAGSSLNVARVCKRFFSDFTGVTSGCFPPSEIFAGLRLPFEERRKTLVVVFSRSGVTSEIIWILQKLRSYPTVKTLLITPVVDSPAVPLADIALLIPAAKEESHTTTKSYTSSILAFKYLVSFLMKNGNLYKEIRTLPDLFKVKQFQREIQKVTSAKPTSAVICGNGINYGHAMEAANIISKIGVIPAVADYASQFRHGIAAHCTPNTLAIVLISDTMKKEETEVLGELATSRCHRLVICEEADNKIGSADFVFELKSKLSENTRDLLMAPILHELGFYMSVQKGVNADKPKGVPFSVAFKEPYFAK